MDSTRRGGTALLTVVGVVVSLGVVAVAARGSTSTGGGGARRANDTLLDIFLSLYVVVLIAGAIFFLYLLTLRRKMLAAAGASPRSHTRDIIGLTVLVAAALFVGRDLAGRQVSPPPMVPQAGTADAARPADPSKEAYRPEFAWIPVAVTVGLLGLAVVGVWWSGRARRRARGELRGSLFADAFAAAVDESLDDLRAETDPRRAVIAAYARLEGVLAAHGLPRYPAEAPLEYLRRMLAELSVSPPAAGRLTELFERAKFSQHAVGPEMKEQAIRALEIVRDDLRAARERAEQERAAAFAALAQRPASR
jgi:Domain of unknown function (DUF4129)